MTDNDFYRVDPIPKNLMFVRFRINTWNWLPLPNVIDYYSDREIPIILTFMAYHEEGSIPKAHRRNYIYRQRTINSYYAIESDAWWKIMSTYRFNIFVYSCGKVEGELGDTRCKHCGNCLREYFATMERIRNE